MKRGVELHVLQGWKIKRTTFQPFLYSNQQSEQRAAECTIWRETAETMLKLLTNKFKLSQNIQKFKDK